MNPILILPSVGEAEEPAFALLFSPLSVVISFLDRILFSLTFFPRDSWGHTKQCLEE